MSSDPNVSTFEGPLAAAVAQNLRDARDDLAARWLDRIRARVSLPVNRVFPTEQLLDHVPLLIGGIADHLENRAADVGAEEPVVVEAMALGELRYAQGFDANQILKEYEILGGILFNHLAEVGDQVVGRCDASDLFHCAHRLFQAIAIVQQTTAFQFLRLSDQRVAERETRIRAFNRMVSHEMKNDIGAILGAGDILETIDAMGREKRLELYGVVTRRARAMKTTLDTLVELSRLETDARTHRHVQLPNAAQEAIRRVRDAAQAAGVEVRISSTLPDIEVNAAVVEFALANYLSNAVKYSRRGATDSFVQVEGEERPQPEGSEVIVRVRDNGTGVELTRRPRLFERFYRAHTASEPIEGMGLGLSLVREMVESVGGRAWAEFPEHESVFAIALPLRRSEAP